MSEDLCKKTWRSLSLSMRRAITDHPSARYHPSTMAALQRRGLIDEYEIITPRGHALLAWVGELAA